MRLIIISILLLFSFNLYSKPVLITDFMDNLAKDLTVDLTTREQLVDWLCYEWEMGPEDVITLLDPRGTFSKGIPELVRENMQEMIMMRGFYILQDEGNVEFNCWTNSYGVDGTFLNVRKRDLKNTSYMATQLIGCQANGEAPQGEYFAMYTFNLLGEDMKISVENVYQ